MCVYLLFVSLRFGVRGVDRDEDVKQGTSGKVVLTHLISHNQWRYLERNVSFPTDHIFMFKKLVRRG